MAEPTPSLVAVREALQVIANVSGGFVDTYDPDALIGGLLLAGYVVVPSEDVREVIDWWRGANEAPGGCSDRDAINGMRDAVRRLYDVVGEPS